MHKYLQINCPKQTRLVANNLASEKVKAVTESEVFKKFYKELGETVKMTINFDLAAIHTDNFHTLKNMGLPYLEFLARPENQRIVGT